MEFLDYIKMSTTPYTTVGCSAKMLSENGFEKLNMNENWNLKPGCGYYVTIYDTSIAAFTVPKKVDDNLTMKVCTAHTDSPCFRVKPSPDMLDKGYLRLNVESYGGGIWNTWLDRPLSVAGKVCVKNKDFLKPDVRIIDIKRPVLTIPNLAIHMNRDVNKGVELNKQTELLPIAGLLSKALSKENFFVQFIADELKVEAKDILDFDLYVYNAESGCEIGIEKEFISAPRLDNLTSCFALIDGLCISENRLNIILLLDNEEVGSHSKQGADSALTRILLEKIYGGLVLDNGHLNNAIFSSMALSVDVAHAFHPAYPGKSDPKLNVICGNGFAIKMNYSQKYATDTEAIAFLEQLCHKADIKYQKYVNRSDMAGGSTIGSIFSSQVPMRTIDIGVPILAMHSARELMAKKDMEYLKTVIKEFMADNA